MPWVPASFAARCHGGLKNLGKHINERVGLLGQHIALLVRYRERQ
jgi:hypothetical protein